MKANHSHCMYFDVSVWRFTFISYTSCHVSSEVESLTTVEYIDKTRAIQSQNKTFGISIHTVPSSRLIQ